MMASIRGNSVLALSALLSTAVLVISQPSAAQLRVSLGVDTELTDNVNLTEDKESDIGTEVFTAFSFRDRSRALEGLVDGRLGYRKYLYGNAPDEIRPNIHANLLFHLQPERFSWAFDGSWDQVRTDALGPAAPGNLENRLVFSTGPDVLLPITASVFFTASARAGYSWSDESDSSDEAGTSNTSYGTSLGLLRARGDGETISAYVTTRAVRYGDADEESSDFSINDLAFGYASRTSPGELRIGVGLSYLDSEEGDDALGFFLQTDANRRLTPLTQAGLRVNFGYNDQSYIALIAPLSVELSNVELRDITESASTGAFYQRRGEFFLERVGRRARLAGTLYVNSDDYVEELPEDEFGYGATIAWSRQLSRFTQLRLSGNAEHINLIDQDEYSRQYAAAVELGRRLSPNLSASFQVRHRRATGSGEASAYEEYAVGFGLVYEFGRSTSQSVTSYGEHSRETDNDPSGNP